MSVGLIFALIGIAGGSLSGLILGHKWSLAVAKKLTDQALRKQREELRTQQTALEKIEDHEQRQMEQIIAAKTTEEAANVLAQLNRSWNAGH